MSTFEEAQQKIIDLRAIVNDPEQDNPTPEIIAEAVQALHATRGLAAKKKAAAKPIIDLADIFKEKPGGA